MWEYSHITEGTRRKEGGEVRKNRAVYIYVFLCESEPLKSPGTKTLFLICPCVSRRDKSNLQMASAVEEHLNPIRNGKTQMDHRRVSVVKEA